MENQEFREMLGRRYEIKNISTMFIQQVYLKVMNLLLQLVVHLSTQHSHVYGLSLFIWIENSDNA